MIPTLLACALVIVALAGCAVASMYVEERESDRRRRRAAGAAEPGPVIAPEPLDLTAPLEVIALEAAARATDWGGR